MPVLTVSSAKLSSASPRALLCPTLLPYQRQTEGERALAFHDVVNGQKGVNNAEGMLSAIPFVHFILRARMSKVTIMSSKY